MKFLDLFSGIGGIRSGLEQAGHTPIGYVEFDKYARQSYEAMYNTQGEWTKHDITEVTNEQWRELRGNVDIIAGGFPCQAFSLAGKRLGFLDQTKGTLFFEIARAVEQIKPRYIFLENVKGLLSHDKGRTFRTILNTLNELGYNAEWQVLNSKNFGVAQNRERIYIIGHLRGERTREVFFETRNTRQTNVQINKVANIENNNNRDTQVSRIYGIDGLSPTLDTGQDGGRTPKILIKSAVKKGYETAYIGDGVNYAYPTSTTRRGLVKHGGYTP